MVKFFLCSIIGLVIAISYSYIHSYKNGRLIEGKVPILIWWTPLSGEFEKTLSCQLGSCLLSENRSLLDSSLTRAVLFYGSSWSLDDIPLPRGINVWWALLHEESPKNQMIFNHKESLSLFNLTSTFKQTSNMPLTLQYLRNIRALVSSNNYVPVKEKNSLLGNIAPIIYLQSDCDPPSERDDYVKELMKYIPVDSYGVCLNNKPLPSHLLGIEAMNANEVLQLIAKYKFTLSLENYGCEDYITEKLWRPLCAGSVPIYWGCPSVHSWLPNEQSIISVRDFGSPKEMASFLHTVMSNDSLYEEYLQHKLYETVTNTKLKETLSKRNWGVDEDQLTKGTFVEHFECFICDEIHRKYDSSLPGSLIASLDHYGCPPSSTVLGKVNRSPNSWTDQWHIAKAEARVLLNLIGDKSESYNYSHFKNELIEYLSESDYL